MQNIPRLGLVGNCQIHRNITSFGGECPQCYRDRMNRYSFSIRQRNRVFQEDESRNNNNMHRFNRSPQRLQINERNININQPNEQRQNEQRQNEQIQNEQRQNEQIQNEQNIPHNITNRYQNREYQNLINQSRLHNQNQLNQNTNILPIVISTTPPTQRVITDVRNEHQSIRTSNQERTPTLPRTPILLRRQNTRLNVVRIPTISTLRDDFENTDDLGDVIGLSMASAYPLSRPVSLNIIQRNTTVEGYSSTRTGNCVICQIDLNKKDATRSLPCNHTFHIMCIDRWFCERNTCPTCRDELK
jgi:hypothetical protein